MCWPVTLPRSWRKVGTRREISLNWLGAVYRPQSWRLQQGFRAGVAQKYSWTRFWRDLNGMLLQLQPYLHWPLPFTDSERRDSPLQTYYRWCSAVRTCCFFLYLKKLFLKFCDKITSSCFSVLGPFLAISGISTRSEPLSHKGPMSMF